MFMAVVSEHRLLILYALAVIGFQFVLILNGRVGSRFRPLLSAAPPFIWFQRIILLFLFADSSAFEFFQLLFSALLLRPLF